MRLWPEGCDCMPERGQEGKRSFGQGRSQTGVWERGLPCTVFLSELLCIFGLNICTMWGREVL
jgi:hypothetical protein